ncbi:MAG TPA: hypothetical protein VGP76_16570 [Planctomycetaceae bacterium]|jgi:hypothetical protein|nr:hypothetical protein [Planctomycetaceae bacterium]
MCRIKQTAPRAVSIAVAVALVQTLAICVAAEKSNRSPPEAGSQPAMPSAQQCRAWALDFEKSIRRNDVASVNRLIDWNALIAKATAMPNPSPTVIRNREQFIAGVKDTLQSGQGAMGEVLKALHQGATYEFLRCREVAGSREVEFRFLLPKKGLNYHAFRLVMSDNGSVRACDWYVFLMGQWQSETLRQTFLPLANTWAKGGAHLIAPAEREFVTHMNDVGAIVECYQKKEFRQALEIYRGLPESVKKNKVVFTIRFSAAQALGGDEQRRAIEEYRQFYPTDAAIDLILLDDLLAKKSFDKALAGVDRIDKAVGGDPYLKVIRARILLKQGQPEAARKMAESAVAEAPTLKAAYYFLVDRSLKEKDFAKTAELLSALEAKCKVIFKDLATVPAYKEFAKSPEYNTWLKSHRGPKEQPGIKEPRTQ